MGTITSGVGLISGINTSSIINQLIAIEQQPKTILQSRKDNVAQHQSALNGFLTQLTSLQTLGQSFEQPSTFQAVTPTSSDPNVLTATAGTTAAAGSYQFQVAQLVSSQQSITTGFASQDASVGAGTFTISLGGGDLSNKTPLSQLNGGAGVRRGQFRITDRSGKSGVIDVGSAVTVDDVIKKINTSLDVNVHAAVQNNQIVLTDTSGGSSANLAVADLADGHAAADLGIFAHSTGTVLTGASINTIGAQTALGSLNDGRGVRTAATSQTLPSTPTGSQDFQVTLGDGSNVAVTLGSAQTLGDVVTAINNAGGGKLTANIDATTNSLKLTDSTGSAPTVTALNNSKAAADLGILKTGAGGVIQGEPILAGIDTVLLSSLKGGAGLSLGQIAVTDRSGNSANVDLSGAKTLQDVLDDISKQSGISVKASLNASGNGIQIADASGGAGNLVIADADPTKSATALGVAGTFDNTKAAAAGADLHIGWINENTLLSTYNGGKGVTPGSFKITNASGAATTIDLSTGTFTKLGDVIAAINGKNAGVTASINANGNGLLLTDTSGGGGTLKVDNLSGTTATDLNIAGAAPGGTGPGRTRSTGRSRSRSPSLPATPSPVCRRRSRSSASACRPAS